MNHSISDNSKNSSIVITQIKIPPYVILGQTVHLYCLFELRNGTDLYTLKWFKDGAEFYRSVPRASVRKNRRLIFPRPGVKVDFENSKVSTFVRWANSSVDRLDTVLMIISEGLNNK